MSPNKLRLKPRETTAAIRIRPHLAPRPDLAKAKKNPLGTGARIALFGVGAVLNLVAVTNMYGGWLGAAAIGDQCLPCPQGVQCGCLSYVDIALITAGTALMGVAALAP